MCAVYAWHHAEEPTTFLRDLFETRRPKYFGVKLLTTICHAVNGSPFPKPPAWPRFDDLREWRRASQHAKTLLQVRREADFESTWIKFWLQLHQVEYADLTGDKSVCVASRREVVSFGVAATVERIPDSLELGACDVANQLVAARRISTLSCSNSKSPHDLEDCLLACSEFRCNVPYGNASFGHWVSSLCIPRHHPGCTSHRWAKPTGSLGRM
jgi:hypothetical protein